METCVAVVVGHICLDIIPTMDHLPEGKLSKLLQPGHLLITGPATFSTGGPVSNTGLALHKLGIPTRLIAKIGQDPLGKIVREIIDRFDPTLSTGLVVDEKFPTSYSIILSAPGVDRVFLHCPGTNDTFGVEDVDYALLEEARLMHFGYPPVMRRMYQNEGRELIELFRRAKETGVTTSLDMTYPDADTEGGRADWLKILEQLLPYVDVFLPSFDELFFMLKREEFLRLREKTPDGNMQGEITSQRLVEFSTGLMQMGVKMAVIKLGDRGLYLRTADLSSLQKMGRAAPKNPWDWAERELWTACYKTRVVGTTGAGDATIAGFLSALLRGFSPTEAVKIAVAVGACNVEAADALSGLRTWEETIRRIEAGWDHLPLQLNEPGWKEVEPGLWERRSESWSGKR